MSIFTQVQLPKIGSSSFNLSHDVKLSLNMGKLVPISNIEALPGDKFKISSEVFLRMAPMLAPVLHEINVKVFHFFVPYRLLWSNWENFITADNEDILAPFVRNLANDITPSSLGDYMGLPNIKNNVIRVSPMSFAAYYKVWDDYFRDQNLQSEIFVPLTDGENAAYETLIAALPQNRAWDHDYFTSCLPFAQKGDAVTLPLINADTAPVELRPFGPPYNGMIGIETADGSLADAGNINLSGGAELQDSDNTQITFDPQGDLIVDINDEAATITTLRRAFALQAWLERNARVGTRYIETILGHFGVKSSDARLQRPELIGVSRGRMNISEVLSSARTTDGDDITTPLGELAGHGISYSKGSEFVFPVEEHGVVISILNVQPTPAYQQGLHKSFTRFDRLDYFWPSFEQIGEQAVLKQEIYAEQAGSTFDDVFGYIPRYAEYKHMNNRVAGDFRTLDFWHMGRVFNAEPALNANFIKCDPTERIFAVQDGGNTDKIYGQVFNKIIVRRRMRKNPPPTI